MTDPRFFRYSAADAIPALLAVGQAMLLATFFIAWPSLGWPARIAGGLAYAFSIGWNLDSVAHNFIHNPFFVSSRLNAAMRYLLTFVNGVPQTMYAYVHMRHHAGNGDRPGPDGETVDPISIYRFGAGDRPEAMIPYVVMQFWRDDDPFAVARQIGAKRPAEARQALGEFWAMAALYGVALAVHWDCVVFLAVFYYLGQCMTALTAYYEHLGGNSDQKWAWGISTYAPVYNWMFLNNGFHAEHHYRPKAHWTTMRAVRVDLEAEPGAGGRFVLKPPHWLGFLDPRARAMPVAGKRGDKRSAPGETSETLK